MIALGDKSYGKEFVLDLKEREFLKILGGRLSRHSSLLKPILRQSISGLKILLFDVETDAEDRGKVFLVGVLTYPTLKIYQYKHKLSRVELNTLAEDAEVVVFVAFNYGFDLVRAFDEDAKRALLCRTTRFGDKIVTYYIYRSSGTVSYALDTMRLANNLLDDKLRSLELLSQTNVYFKKLKSESFVDLRYNAYDLLSEFELLVRCVEKAAEFLDVLEFQPLEVIDFILKQNWYETIESHMAPIKFFESGSRIAKVLMAPYARSPSFPAFYAGGRVQAFKVGRFQKFGFYDINSEYPAVMSRFSPKGMKLVFGNDARELVQETLAMIQKCGMVEAFHSLYVEQCQPTLILSSWILIQFIEDATWLVEVLKEKSKKFSKLSPYTLIYRNRREEQARTEGFVRFRQGDVVQVPLYFLFLQSKEQLKRIRVLDACGFCIEKDDSWIKRWEMLFELRKSTPALAASLKIAMNAVTGLMCDVDQFFSNLALGAHVTAYSRTISYLVQRELQDKLLYVDTDGFAVESDAEDQLCELLGKLAPWGAKKEYVDSKELVVFRAKRYAIQLADGTWMVKGAERTGFGREKNKIESFLMGSERLITQDIRQVTKQAKTPNIPAVRKLLKTSESGEWCFYFSYPLSEQGKIAQKRQEWFDVVSDVVNELESGGSGESLENEYGKKICKLAEWTGFIKKPSKKMSKAQWFLEWFEWMRAYGFAAKQEIYELVRRRIGVDLAVVEAQMLSYEYYAKLDDSLVQESDESVVFEVTKNRRVYVACRIKERLVKVAEKLTPLPSARLMFEASKLEEGISSKVFAPLLGKPDTTFLEAQISQASLLHLPMALNEKMRLLSQAIGRLGNSDNRGVKLSVETLKVSKGTATKCDPEILPMPRRARKRSPFSQRRFYVEQRFPYKVRYHVGIDAVKGSQFEHKKFIFQEGPSWLPLSLAAIINCFLHDIILLENRLNKVISETIAESGNILFKWLCTDGLKLKVVPYARYTRFDVAYDIPHYMIKEKIEEFEEICERENWDYRKGLGFIGLNGRVLSTSHCFVSGNIVLYDRLKRFNIKTNQFLRRYKPFVESWQNEPMGRLEIQCFAHRSNNRKANPFAALLNVLELFKLRAPSLFRFIESLLSVINNMLRDLPERSGVGGLSSQKFVEIQSNQRDSVVFFRFTCLAALGLVT